MQEIDFGKGLSQLDIEYENDGKKKNIDECKKSTMKKD
jgi:hypothetical protein